MNINHLRLTFKSSDSRESADTVNASWQLTNNQIIGGNFQIIGFTAIVNASRSRQRLWYQR